MTASRILTLRAAIGLAAVLGGCWTHASDPRPEPQSIARDAPAFRAPAEPPEVTLEEEAAPAEPAGPLGLHDALALALMWNPELAEFSWESRASEARALQANKLPNPELDIRVWRLSEQNGIADVGRRRVILSQVLEFGAKRRRRFLLAQTEQEMADWDYEAKRIEVATTVAVDFTTVLGAQRRAESMKGFLAFVEGLRETVSALVESGSMRSVEIHQISRQIGLARIELQRAESELAAARFKLASAWRSRSPRFTEAVGDLEEVRPVPDIETVLELAQSSPAIARSESEIARGQAALALAKARRVPDVTIGAGVRWIDSLDQQDYILDFEISLPIFDRKQGDIREARYQTAKAQAGRTVAMAVGSEAIAESYYALKESRARISTLGDEVLPATRAAFEAFRLAFENQAEDFDDLLDARRDLLGAEIQYTDGLVDYHHALATLESIAGQSLP